MQSQSDYIVFADESGDHSLTNLNPDYPVFVLSFCVFRKSDYVETVCPVMQRFKLRWWPHDAIVLHSSQIRRQERPFLFLKSLEKREKFMLDLAATVVECPFTLIAGIIHKARLRQKFALPENPYSLALNCCLEMTHSFLCDRGHQDLETSILVERRGRREDAELELAFRRLCSGRMRGFSIEFVDKKANLAGLQIADLVSTPIGQHLIRPGRMNRAFAAIEPKFRRSPDGEVTGYGLKVVP